MSAQAIFFDSLLQPIRDVPNNSSHCSSPQLNPEIQKEVQDSLRKAGLALAAGLTVGAYFHPPLIIGAVVVILLTNCDVPPDVKNTQSEKAHSAFRRWMDNPS